MRFSQSSAYAVHAMLQLATADGVEPVPCSQLAARGGMPERFLLQVLRGLTRRGLLRSTRGGGGGFNLARSAEEISILQVIEAVDGPVACGLPDRDGFPEKTARQLNSTLETIARTARQRLGQVSLQSLVNGNHGDDSPAERP